MRIAACARLRFRNAHAVQCIYRTLCSTRRIHAHMQLQGFGDLPPNGVNRIQRSHRLLKNHSDIAPAHRLQFRRR